MMEGTCKNLVNGGILNEIMNTIKVLTYL